MKQNSFLIVSIFCACLTIFFAYLKVGRGEASGIEIQNDSIVNLKNDIRYRKETLAFQISTQDLQLRTAFFINAKK